MKTPFNRVNVHVKVESLVKDAAKTFEDLSEQGPRSVVWYNYAIAAIYSGVFNRVKLRLKELLKPHIRYVDGDTPITLSKFISGITGVNWLTTSDGSKFDITIDEQMLKMESYIYKKLGM